MPRYCITCTDLNIKPAKRASFNFKGEKGAKYCMAHKIEKMDNTNNKMCESCHAVTPYFNFPDKKGGIRCAGCQLPGMKNVVAKKCLCGCGQIPSFGLPEDTAPSHCSLSKNLKMIDLRHPSCRWTDDHGSNRCQLQPSFNHPSMITPIYCSQHATDEMINVRNKSDCPGNDNEGCNGRSTYNFANEKRPVYCNQHKTSEMINLRDSKCPGKDNVRCPNSRTYNNHGLKATFCLAHKEDGMVNLTYRKCQEIINEVSCTKRASFNYLGDIKPIYCKEHSKTNMIDVRHKRCENCTLTASFNYVGNRTPVRCSIHKEPDMISVKHRYCEHENGCNILASYNYIGMKPIFCFTHRLTGMINLGQKVCENPTCVNKPKYNYPGETIRRFCDEHQLTDMVNLSHGINICIEKDCINMPLYNLLGKKPIKCKEHSSPEMINLDEAKKCSHPDCTESPIASLNSTFYCEGHYPDKSAIANFRQQCWVCDSAPTNFMCDDCKRISHKKEWQAVCYLKKRIHLIPMLDTNLPVKECSKRRPDLYYDGLKHVVIVEVDENEHEHIAPECECARISEIVGSIGGRSVIFIRYNPDKIRNKGREIIIPIPERLEKVVSTVKEELNKTYDTFCVMLIQLYYNDHYETYQPYKVEDITNLVTC